MLHLFQKLSPNLLLSNCLLPIFVWLYYGGGVKGKKFTAMHMEALHFQTNNHFNANAKKKPLKQQNALSPLYNSEETENILTTFPSQDILRTSFTSSCEWCSFRNSIHTSPVSRMLT